MSNKITVGQLRQIIKEELEQSIKTQELSNEIEDWVEQHRAELEKFYASNPKAAIAVQKAASNQNQHVNENDFIDGVKNYYSKGGSADVKLAATGMTFGWGAIPMMLPDNLRNSLFSSVGEIGTLAGSAAVAILAGHLADVALHASQYADKKKNQKIR